MGQARPWNKEATGVLRQTARDSRAEGDAERREEKGSRPGDAEGSVCRHPGESAVVQGRGVMVGMERRARGQASSAQAESSVARASGLHLLHRLEESHRCTTPACPGFSDSLCIPPWAPPLTTQISETRRSYFYPCFTEEEPEEQRNVWNCTWHTVSNICSC